VHIDGYVAVQATTVVVRVDGNEPVKGKAADVIKCAQTCFEAAMRLVRPGRQIGGVAGPLNQIAEMYGCSLVDGVMTHNMKQFVIDGNKCILNRPAPDQKVEDHQIEELEVYAIDIVVSTGVLQYQGKCMLLLQFVEGRKKLSPGLPDCNPKCFNSNWATSAGGSFFIQQTC
jgi:methionine aminopeptidase